MPREGLEVCDPLDSLNHEFADPLRRDAGPGGQKSQELDPFQRLLGRVGMKSGKGPPVAGVQCLEEIEDFLTAAFTEQDPVWPHPERLPEQFTDRHRTEPVRIVRT